MTNIAQTPEKNKLKIKVPVVQSADHEIEIDLPYYFKESSSCLVRLDSPEQQVRVFTGLYSGISVFTPFSDLGKDIAHGKPCTEQEFNEAFQTVLLKIQNL